MSVIWQKICVISVVGNDVSFCWTTRPMNASNACEDKKLLISHPMMNKVIYFRFYIIHNAKCHSRNGNKFESIIQLIE